MQYDWDACDCPICRARARGVWPKFVEPKSDPVDESMQYCIDFDARDVKPLTYETLEEAFLEMALDLEYRP